MVTRVETKKYGRRYPWDEWLSRSIVVLLRDRDFNGRPDTFIQLVRRAAVVRRLSLGITVSENGRIVTIRIIGRLREKKRGRRSAATRP